MPGSLFAWAATCIMLSAYYLVYFSGQSLTTLLELFSVLFIGSLFAIQNLTLQNATGNLFTPIDRVWSAEPMVFAVAHRNRLMRNQIPFVPILGREGGKTFRSSRKLPKAARTWNEYQWTRETAVWKGAATRTRSGGQNRPEYSAAVESDDTIAGDLKDDVWRLDMFGNTSGDKVAQLAHLMPNSSRCADRWLDVARMIYARRNATRDECRKLVHGSRSKGARMSRTGARHSTANRVNLVKQFEAWDSDNRLLAIPIMSVDEMLNWSATDDGTSRPRTYSAMVIGGASTVNPHRTAASSVDMTCANSFENQKYCVPMCSKEEIEQARGILEAVTLGLASSLKRFCGNEMNKASNPTLRTLGLSSQDFETTRVQFLKQEVTTVHVPRAKRCAPVFVRKITFNNDHPAPDPLLLAIKAAVVWSWRNGEKLLPGCEMLDDETEDPSDMSSPEFDYWEEEEDWEGHTISLVADAVQGELSDLEE